MFVLPDLLYPADALEPVMSATTVNTHHGKHHRRYVEVTNQLMEKLGWKTQTLEDVVAEAKRANERALFNNAAQAWNHGFFWVSMSPQPSQPSGALAEAIKRDFGGMAGLREKFVAEGVAHFGSGWVWLIVRNGKLEVVSTHDADTPLAHSDMAPILTCDVWEHAYYLDFKNDRKSFLEQWFDKLASWSFAEREFAAPGSPHRGWQYPAQVEHA